MTISVLIEDNIVRKRDFRVSDDSQDSAIQDDQTLELYNVY